MSTTNPRPSLPVRPNPDGNASSTAPAIVTGYNTTMADSPPTATATATGMSKSSTAAASSGDQPQPSRTRRQSTAEAVAAAADLEDALVSPTTADQSTPHDQAGAERARTATEAWKPAMNRRQSWSKEEHKRSLQMSFIADVKTGPGFSERGAQ